MIFDLNKSSQTILVTGSAGFIGFHLAKELINAGFKVIGIDNINSYYDPGLKFARLEQLGIPRVEAEIFHQSTFSRLFDEQFTFIRMDIEDRQKLPELFNKFKFEKVCHMAAQAGVRYSLEKPEAYVDSNVVGFLNILECCRQNHISHLIYASSSSVYGETNKMPFQIENRTDKPISLYAATKKCNELMAHVYSNLYKLPTTGLRFFTVYGPWGRPDMALFLFTKAILNNEPINVFNSGDMSRDFTFIDDITLGILNVVLKDIETRKLNNEYYKLYNIGNRVPVQLLDFIKEIEKNLKIKAVKKMFPMQKGDIKSTWANIDEFRKDYNYQPHTDMPEGVKSFIKWYVDFYNLNGNSL